MRTICLLAILGLSMPALAAARPATEQSCTKLARISLPHAYVTSATLMQAATDVPGTGLKPAQTQSLPSFCRVIVTDHPSSDSDIKTEIWLPASGWNGKYRGQGNGGFAGEIAYNLMAAALRSGYATAGTDTGHTGHDPDFALGHPEKIKDFGWRAIHDMTMQAKAVTTAYYTKAPTHSYFAACSDGGREALMEAQRFPTDYDGILAGAPAYNWTALTTAGAANTQAMLATPTSYIPASKLPAIASAVLAACDKNVSDKGAVQNDVQDGVIDDPPTCKFQPSSMLCRGVDADTCLLPDQVKSLETLYAAKLDTTGKEILPGYEPGGELGPNGWSTWITGASPGKSLQSFFGVGFFRYFVYDNPEWNYKSFKLLPAYQLANEKTSVALNATDTNLKPFLSRGGKLMMYHGWDDPAIPALSSVRYYHGLIAKLGRQTVDTSVRLYMVPGMQHCNQGPGATEFGENFDEPRGDAQHDIFTALEQWVEKDTAPGTLTAIKPEGTPMSRPLCVYPAQANYVSGDPQKAESFQCVTPTK